MDVFHVDMPDVLCATDPEGLSLSALNPQPSTLNPQPSTLNSQPSTPEGEYCPLVLQQAEAERETEGAK